MDDTVANYRPSGMRIFFIVWLGQLVSLTGSSLTGFALGVWVYRQTGSVTQFALISLCTVGPAIALAPLAGALVDRCSHRWTMLLSDTGAGLSLLAIASLLFAERLEIWHIYVATAISSTFGAFQWPAYNAATTLLVPKKRLGRASGMIQTSWAVGQLAAPLLGALMLEVVKLEGVILLDFASFLFAVVTLLSVRFPNSERRVMQEARKGLLFGEVTYGWTYIVSRPGILALLVFFAAENFLIGIVEVLVTPLVLSFASTVTLGTILSVGGFGMLIGSLVMSLWGGPQRRMMAVFGFMMLCGLCTTVAGLVTSSLLLAVVAFLFFFGISIVNACGRVVLQKKVALSVQGRVFALQLAVQGASLPFGYVVAGPLADYVFEPLMAGHGFLADSLGLLIGVGPGRGIGLMFVVVGLLTMVVTVVAYRYPRLRQVEDELPDATPDHEIPGQAELLTA